MIVKKVLGGRRYRLTQLPVKIDNQEIINFINQIISIIDKDESIFLCLNSYNKLLYTEIYNGGQTIYNGSPTKLAQNVTRHGRVTPAPKKRDKCIITNYEISPIIG